MEYIIEDLDRPVIDDASFEAWKKLDSFTEKLNNFDTVVGVINDLWDIEDSDNELRDKIQAADMTPAERAEALKKASELKSDRQMFLLLTTCFTVATAAYAGPPALVFSLILGAITTSSDFFWNMRMANILNCGTGFSCNWCIDPSGYVYEAVTRNRVSDVTATAYWISPDYINENGEGDASKAVVWDASEYAQMNPVLTDETGAYAWDVPEGLWQVKYEKEGYKTAYSDWLPVPPPQTDVNVGLISTEAPRVESAVLIHGGATLNFTQYMQPETVKNLTVTSADGKTLDYTVSYSSDETAPDGTVYAKSYIVNTPDGTPDSITVPADALNYAGTPMAASSTVKVADSRESVSVELSYDEEIGDVVVTFDPPAPADGTVTVVYSDGTTATVTFKQGDSEVTVPTNGKKPVSVTVTSAILPVKAEAHVVKSKAIRGDLNSSGKVDVMDGVIMQRILAGLETDSALIALANLDSAGKVDVKDGVIMQRILAGLES